jgi:prolipoprotein diacylglyceryltransferase
MKPILGRYGPFLLYSYSLALGGGLLLALAWTLYRRRGRTEKFDRLLAALVVGILGGRAAFVLANWSYFDGRLAQAIDPWRGGLGYHGALVAGLLCFWLWPGDGRRALADAAAPGLVLLAGAGWLACYLEGCAYGAETTLGLWAADLPDVYGVFAVRYQTQLLGLVGSLLVLGGLLLFERRRSPPGTRFWAALLAVSLLHGGLTFLRGDAQLALGGWRADTIANGALALAALVLLVAGLRWPERPAA